MWPVTTKVLQLIQSQIIIIGHSNSQHAAGMCIRLVMMLPAAVSAAYVTVAAVAVAAAAVAAAAVATDAA